MKRKEVIKTLKKIIKELEKKFSYDDSHANAGLEGRIEAYRVAIRLLEIE